MKTLFVYLLTAITLVGLLNACGPSEEEKQAQREKARQDSLQRVEQQRLQQQRLDSIQAAQARADSIQAAKEQKEKERKMISYNETGAFSIQVEAWRSRDKAQQQVSKWQERGFENAYVVKHGNPETGDIWFRVRLGRVNTMEMAERVGTNLQEEYGEKYWIAMAIDESGDMGKSAE